MTKEELLKGVIEGGYYDYIDGIVNMKQTSDFGFMVKDKTGQWYHIHFSDKVFDPYFWEAVSKGLGWGESNRCGQCRSIVKEEDVTPYWHKVMHDLLDAKIKGESLTEFIEKL